MRLDKVEDEVEVSDQVSLEVTGITQKDGKRLVRVTLTPPEDPEAKVPQDIICVVDMSGSMGTEVGTKDANGIVECHGLSILDLVIHAVRTVAASLGPEDRFSVVTFSDKAKVVLSLAKLTEQRKKLLDNKLNKWKPQDRTNIWDGLSTALEIVENSNPQKEKRIASILLFTDGMPNICPPRGELGMLNRWIETHGDVMPATLDTFGFGYDIDSTLLMGLAVRGGGAYSFIPDASLLGTVFVNSVSNHRSTFGRDAQLLLEPLNGAKFGPIPAGLEFKRDGNGGKLTVSSLQLGQKRDYVFPMEVSEITSPFVKVTLVYNVGDGKQYGTFAEGNDILHGNSSEIALHMYRQRVVELLKDLTREVSSDAAGILAKEIRGSLNGDVYADGIVEDLQGQVTMAMDPTAHKRWGRHFLPSLARAHQQQQCNNFKDPGVQHYGGKFFQKVRGEVDDIFFSVPPPKPSVKPSVAAARVVQPLYSMAGYNNAYGGCFSGDSEVLMQDLSVKKVSEIKRGDSVLTPSGVTKVRCVVRCLQPGISSLCLMEGGLKITPYHPVFMGKWVFPRDIVTPQAVRLNCVYTFLLENRADLIINGLRCVTLGHNIEGDDVASHDFFGTERVVDELRRCGGWASGDVSIKIGGFLRGEDGRVCGFEEEVCHPRTETSCSEISV